MVSLCKSVHRKCLVFIDAVPHYVPHVYHQIAAIITLSLCKTECGGGSFTPDSEHRTRLWFYDLF